MVPRPAPRCPAPAGSKVRAVGSHPARRIRRPADPVTDRTQHPLPPGFMVVHGNQPESLRDLMLAWMERHPLAPLEDELVLVQSNGVAQWLKLSLAADRRQGGLGVAAAIRTELPSRALWDAYRAVLGPEAVPAQSALDEARLAW